MTLNGFDPSLHGEFCADAIEFLRDVPEDKYDLMKIYSYLDKLFQKRGMKKEDGWYINGNFTTCGAVIIHLTSKDWFLDNVDEWLWYDEDDESTEDLKAHYRKEATVIA